MIHLKNLKLLNFLSHENTEIAFNTNEKLLIDGNSGSGKSSVLEAVIWGLYGTGRSSNSALIRRGAAKAEVLLTLDNDGVEILIHRKVSQSKHSLEITIDGVAHPYTGVRELQNYIETELTGASYMLFVNSIAYLQGGAESFVGQNAGKRKELLLEIIKTIDFDTYYEKTKSKITEFETQEILATNTIRDEEAAINAANGYVEKKEAKGIELASKKAKLGVYESEKAELTKQLSGSTERQEKITKKTDEVARATKKVDDAKAMVTATESRLHTFSEILSTPRLDVALLSKERDEKKEKWDEVREALANIAEINAARVTHLTKKPVDGSFIVRAETLEAEIQEMSGENKCPHGDECPNFSSTKTRIDAKKAEAELLRGKAAIFIKEMEEWQTAYDAMPELEVGELSVKEKELSLAVTTLDTQIRTQEKIKEAEEQSAVIQAELETRKAERFELDNELINLESELNELKKIGDTQEEAKASLRLAEIEALMVLTNKEISELEREMGVIENYEQLIPGHKEAIKTAEVELTKVRHNLKQLGVLKDAFGSKGIRALVIDYIIPELEDKINDILSQMSEFRVILDTQQEKASGDGNKEGLFITIVNDMSEEMPFENYSGGEKLKIVVAITEALATLQKCGFRLFDETWVGLDEMSLESFTHVLDTLLERFPQVVCVSHLTEIKAAFENKITITKHNGISHVD